MLYFLCDSMKKLSFYNIFYIFIFSSILGYIIEFFWTLLKKGVLINHSAVVIGPFNFVYGIGAVIFTILLYRFKDLANIKLFFLSFIIGSIMEYMMSLGIELIIGFPAWDYSQKFMNLNGRIALMYSILWGLLGLLWIKYVYNWMQKLIDKINKKIGKIIMILLSIFLIFDIVLTLSAVNRAKAWEKGIPAQNKYEELLDKTFNRDYLKNMFNNRWK